MMPKERFMKFHIAVLTTAMLIFSSLVWSADNRRDGNWWLRQEKYVKTIYAIGFSDGMDLGNRFSYWKYLNGTKAQQGCAVQAVDSYREYSQKYFGNVTAGQLSDGLDSFYADYKNRRILVSNAVWLVANGIVGTPEEKLNKMIESWRQNSGD
jgi:hypothetical protein